MKINLLAFGIAKDILNAQRKEIILTKGQDVHSLKIELQEAYPDFKKLRSLSFAVNETYREDDFELKENDEVVIIPPVSGG